MVVKAVKSWYSSAVIAANPAYRPRMADRTLADLLADFPAILVNGARAVGKTTTARQFASDEVRLDQPSQAAAFKLRQIDQSLLAFGLNFGRVEVKLN